MCDEEGVQTLQRGMNFRLNPRYSLILMSRRANAPYRDKVHDDGVTIEYEGHDEPKTPEIKDPKEIDQPRFTKNGSPTQNGNFIETVERFKSGTTKPEIVKVYEKIRAGVWSLKGLFELIDYKIRFDGRRNSFIFLLRLTNSINVSGVTNDANFSPEHTRLIPTEVKIEVWKRDKGMCVKCGETTNLHFDHDLPYSKGGTSLSAKNVRLLCMKDNLQKSGKIE